MTLPPDDDAVVASPIAPMEVTPAAAAEAAELIAHSMALESPQPDGPGRAGFRVAILTFDGFNELDTFIALGLINRLGSAGWKAEIASPTTHVTSMNGVTIQAQQALEFANEADAVIFGSGIHTRAIAQNSAILDRLQLDPVRQLIGAQCSGALLLARLGLLGDMPACTDLTTKPWLIELGVLVEEDAFHARGGIATAGGCLASQYLAAWMMVKGAGLEAATQALMYAAPVGEKEAYVERLLAAVTPFIDGGR